MPSRVAYYKRHAGGAICVDAGMSKVVYELTGEAGSGGGHFPISVGDFLLCSSSYAPTGLIGGFRLGPAGAKKLWQIDRQRGGDLICAAMTAAHRFRAYAVPQVCFIGDTADIDPHGMGPTG